MRPLPRLLPAVLAVALAACSMAPTYKRPDAPIPSAYPNGPAYSTPGAAAPQAGPAAPDLGWRDFFADPALQQLIAQALANNRDLRIATLNIDEARALYRIQRAAQFPAITAGAGLVSQRLPSALRATGQDAHTNAYSANVGMTNFELDVFGRVRSLSQAAQEQYLATEEARRSVHISLVAEVIEATHKPSQSWGERGRTSFEGSPSAPRREGSSQRVQRALLALGEQDVDPAGLIPPRGTVIRGASSDHLVVESPGQLLAVGDEQRYELSYSALLRAMTSPFVDRCLVDGSIIAPSARCR